MDSAAVRGAVGVASLLVPPSTDSAGEWGEGTGVWEGLEQVAQVTSSPSGIHTPWSPLHFLPIALGGGEWASFITGDGMKLGGPLPCAPTCPREEH